MRKIFEWMGGFALIVFSFYFTDKVSMIVANKSELMASIKAVSAEYSSEAIDAVIDKSSNTIVPGKFGRQVNNEESYLSMHDFGSFNENFLVYNYIKPKISLEDNKDKYISGGNKTNRKVSLIIENNEEIADSLEKSKIYYDYLSDIYTGDSEYKEEINVASDKTSFNIFTSKAKNVPKICIKDLSDESLCKKNSYYIIQPTITLTSTNVASIKNNISPGSFILISSGVKLDSLKVVLNEIEYKDLSIVHVSKLIDEKES